MFRQEIEIDLLIDVFEEDRLSSVAARRHIVRQAGHNNAGKTCNRQSLALSEQTANMYGVAEFYPKPLPRYQYCVPVTHKTFQQEIHAADCCVIASSKNAFPRPVTMAPASARPKARMVISHSSIGASVGNGQCCIRSQ